MGFLDDVVGGVTQAVGGLAKDVEGAASVLAGPAGGVVGPLLGGLMTGGASSLFTELPQLLGGLSGLLGGGQQGFNFPQQPFPFSPGASGIQANYFNNPSQLLGTLNGMMGRLTATASASASTTPAASGGIGGQLNSLNTGGISNQINDLMNQATQAAQSGDALTAQKDMIQAQIMFQTISQLMNTIGEMQKQALQNSKLN